MSTRSCAVLFDIDGTLVDSTYHHALAWQRAFRVCEIVVPLYRIHRAVGMGGDKLVGQVAGDEVEDRLGDRLRSAWHEEYAALEAEVVPLPGAAELVHELATAGFRVALASSGEPDFASGAVASLGVEKDLACLTTSEDVDASKPDPDLVGETLSRLEGVTHAVLVGDTPYDVLAARRAGIACVGLLSGGYSEAELTEAGAVLVAGVPADLQHADWTELCVEVPRT